MEPPGRFLKKDSDGLWYEIKEEEAIEKARQALSEKHWVPFAGSASVRPDLVEMENHAFCVPKTIELHIDERVQKVKSDRANALFPPPKLEDEFREVKKVLRDEISGRSPDGTTQELNNSFKSLLLDNGVTFTRDIGPHEETCNAGGSNKKELAVSSDCETNDLNESMKSLLLDSSGIGTWTVSQRQAPYQDITGDDGLISSGTLSTAEDLSWNPFVVVFPGESIGKNLDEYIREESPAFKSCVRDTSTVHSGVTVKIKNVGI